jgi:hypothetical protein
VIVLVGCKDQCVIGSVEPDGVGKACASDMYFSLADGLLPVNIFRYDLQEVLALHQR